MSYTHLRTQWPVILAVAVTVTTWASAFAGIRAGLLSYSPQSVALLRYATASLVLAAYALATRMPLPQWRDWPGLALLGFIGISVYNVVLNVGETHIAAGTASLIVAAAPIFVALLASIFYQERLTVISWAGIALSIVGVALISIDFRTGLELSPSALLILVAALAQSIFTTFQKPFLRRYSPLQLTATAIWAATFFLLWFLPGLWHDLQQATPAATTAVLYMGIFPGAIGYVCWAFVLSRLPASRAGTFLYLVPAVALIIAWFWLGEQPALIALLGGLLIVSGVVVVNVQRSRKAAPAAPVESSATA